MYPTGGDSVVRYDESYSTLDGTLGGTPDPGHFHEDGLIMGGDNDKGIGPDIDVYKNIVIGYFDDGMETDGDGTNDCVWGNYFDYGGASCVSSTSVNVGERRSSLPVPQHRARAAALLRGRTGTQRARRRLRRGRHRRHQQRHAEHRVAQQRVRDVEHHHDQFDLTNASGNDLDYDVTNGKMPTSLEAHSEGSATLGFQSGNG